MANARNESFSVEYDGGTITGPSEAAVREAIAEMEAMKAREARRRELWGQGGPDGMVRLCQRFPSLRRVEGAGIGAWDPLAVLAWSCAGVSHGEALAGRLVLRVWNSTADWNEEARREGLLAEGQVLPAFDLFEAWSVWDLEHREAALAWLNDPFWP